MYNEDNKIEDFVFFKKLFQLLMLFPDLESVFPRSFFIAYTPPATARKPSPPSIGAWEGADGNAGWAITTLVVIKSIAIVNKNRIVGFILNQLRMKNSKLKID